MKKIGILLLGTAFLSGCGSDDSDDSRASNTYVGAIEAVSTDFDSITVNSMPLSLTNARIELNNTNVNATELAVGMQVDVEYDNGVAYEVDIDPQIVGTVTAITATTVTVNGQALSTETDFTGTINPNEKVMLFGYVDQTGNWKINAAYGVGSIPVEDLFEGKIISIDNVGNSFTIEPTMTVNYSTARLDPEDIAELKVGAWVEVEGNYNAPVFVATDVDVEDDLVLANAEVEGYITNINADKTSMILNGKTVVVISPTTRFVKENANGDDVASDNSILVLNAKVEVDLINRNGVLEATEIELDN
ncbi:MAG: hypothetical protein GY920_13365 [Aliivibrio sp.]|nr:hypothetical protein [Aliivibrio sp.]